MASLERASSRYLPEDDEDCNELCDMLVVVQGQHLPVNSGVLAMQSRVFRKMVIDLRNDKNSRIDGKLAIPLDDSVSLADAELMLAFVHGKRHEVETADEASRLLLMADKYDMPSLFRISDKKINGLAHRMHFIPPAHSSSVAASTGNRLQPDAGLDAAHWLGIADRLGLDEFRTQCQYVILRDIAGHFLHPGERPSIKEALASLDAKGVSAKSMGEIAATFAGTIHALCQARKIQDIRLDTPKFKGVICDVLKMFKSKGAGEATRPTVHWADGL